MALEMNSIAHLEQKFTVCAFASHHHSKLPRQLQAEKVEPSSGFKGDFSLPMVPMVAHHCVGWHQHDNTMAKECEATKDLPHI